MPGELYYKDSFAITFAVSSQVTPVILVVTPSEDMAKNAVHSIQKWNKDWKLGIIQIKCKAVATLVTQTQLTFNSAIQSIIEDYISIKRFPNASRPKNLEPV